MNRQLQADLCAYIQVLGVEDVINKVPSTGLITGCLMRLEDALAKLDDRKSKQLLDLIRQRERINGQKPYGDPELVNITNQLAHACLDYYENTRT